MTIKVCFLLDCLYGDAGGGTETQFLKLYNLLPAYGIEAHVYFLRHEPIHDTLKWHGPVTTLEIGSNFSPSTFLKLKALARELDENGISLVHTFFDDSCFCAALLKVFCGNYKVFGSLRNMGYNHTWFRKLWLSWAFKQMNKVLVNAEIIGHYLQSTFGVKKENVVVIRNIYDQSHVVCLTSDEQEYYTKIRKNKRYIAIIVANLKPIKGIDDLFSAVDQSTLSDIAYCFIGNDQNEHYQKLSQKMGIDQHCFFLGTKNNVSAHLNNADFSILPSRTEGLSNSLIEYLYARLPVIATHVGGTPEVLQNGLYGMLVPPQNPLEMKEAIDKTVGDLLALTKKADNTFDCVKDSYSAKKIIGEYQDLYLLHLEEN